MIRNLILFCQNYKKPLIIVILCLVAILIHRLNTTTVKNAVVTDFGNYTLRMENGYSEDQNTIKINKHSKCLRSHLPFAEDLKIGDRLEFITWRWGIVGPCDYVVRYKKYKSLK